MKIKFLTRLKYLLLLLAIILSYSSVELTGQLQKYLGPVNAQGVPTVTAYDGYYSYQLFYYYNIYAPQYGPEID